MSRRVMEDIFWLGRYTERVDYHARLIDANFQEYQESSGFEADRLPLWQRLMEMLGELQSYQTGHPEPGEKSILFFLTLDPDHANSIASCLNLARNNARAVRERIPGFVWEAINETYLWLRDKNISAIFEASPYLFYQHIKERIALFYGIADSSMLRRHEWHILQCGRYMERAENTVRILQMLVKCSEVCRDQVSPEQYQQLLTLLKTVDGVEGFRRFYASELTAENVYRFLLLNSEFPRSVSYALLGLDRNLKLMQRLEGNSQLRVGRITRLLKRIQALLLGLDEESSTVEDQANFLHSLLVLCNEMSREFSMTVFNMED